MFAVFPDSFYGTKKTETYRLGEEESTTNKPNTAQKRNRGIFGGGTIFFSVTIKNTTKAHRTPASVVFIISLFVSFVNTIFKKSCVFGRKFYVFHKIRQCFYARR